MSSILDESLTALEVIAKNFKMAVELAEKARKDVLLVNKSFLRKSGFTVEDINSIPEARKGKK